MTRESLHLGHPHAAAVAEHHGLNQLGGHDGGRDLLGKPLGEGRRRRQCDLYIRRIGPPDFAVELGTGAIALFLATLLQIAGVLAAHPIPTPQTGEHRSTDLAICLPSFC